MTDNEKAFLDMIAWSEGTIQIPGGDDGYRVIVGSTPSNPHLFQSYEDHPRILVKINDHLQSTAAGRYQILSRYFSAYKKILKLPDFSPDSQDKIALQLMKECKAIDLINKGHIVAAIIRCSSRWASFPGNTYQQHTNNIDDLKAEYIKAGGKEASY
jgi:muramidase (phage lysozyme)